MAYLGRQPVIGNFVKLDAISVVNGQAAYTMQNNSVNFTDYATVNQFLVSLNGTIQSPTSSFTVSGSTITFASNLATGDVIDFIIVFGNSLSAGTPTDGSVSLAKLSATGTKDATTFLRGDNTFAEAGGGITEADQWRVTANITSNADPIASNLERIDDASFSKIGTGVSVSSGVWSFPSTGLWQVSCFLTAIGDTQADNHIIAVYATTNNGSAWDEIFQVCGGVNATAAQGNQNTGYLDQFVNVTDISNVKIKFVATSISNGYIMGNSALTLTGFKFIRLGDSQ
jgi:hypothetical protein